MQPATKFNDLLQRAQALPEELAGPVVFARRFLVRKKIKSHHATFWVSLGEGEDAPAIVYETFIELGAERAADLEAELFSELMRQDFPAERDGRVVITLSSRGRADYRLTSSINQDEAKQQLARASQLCQFVAHVRTELQRSAA